MSRAELRVQLQLHGETRGRVRLGRHTRDEHPRVVDAVEAKECLLETCSEVGVRTGLGARQRSR